MKKIVALDFDGTVVTHEYPEVGKDVPNAVKTLRRLVDTGCRIILWTMRSDETLQDAVAWFTDNEIPLWGVNENPEQKEWTNSPKAYAPLYIDDAALGCPLKPACNGERSFVDWFEVERQLEEKGLFV